MFDHDVLPGFPNGFYAATNVIGSVITGLGATYTGAALAQALWS